MKLTNKRLLYDKRARYRAVYVENSDPIVYVAHSVYRFPALSVSLCSRYNDKLVKVNRGK